MMKFALAAVALAALAGSALAHEYTLGNLEIDHPHARATMPNAPVAGGYMTIRNTGDAPDVLVGGTASFAGMVQIHEMTMDGEVMKMRPVEGGLEIPAGGEVVLEPGGYHVMFIGLKEPLREGDKRAVRLEFRDAGAIDVEFNVEAMKPADGAGHGHGHGHGNGEHKN